MGLMKYVGGGDWESKVWWQGGQGKEEQCVCVCVLGGGLQHREHQGCNSEKGGAPPETRFAVATSAPSLR